ncbi:hypothetical protein Pla8534_50420 [Lignipirellula cremea]|uniref:Uncharacterized protein n=1 Tax=Lignipirellula cremea TaxID=2528010 RepID=A0A518DZC3_9BACT|nr:hypothetical protein Pla8534_50420 [Lignipirellula cremea]
MESFRREHSPGSPLDASDKGDDGGGGCIGRGKER